jgi:hypothetical protein
MSVTKYRRRLRRIAGVDGNQGRKPGPNVHALCQACTATLVGTCATVTLSCSNETKISSTGRLSQYAKQEA